MPAQKAHPDKSMLTAAMKARTSVANAWLAERLNMAKPASASQFARRWMLALHDRKAVAALVSRVKT